MECHFSFCPSGSGIIEYAFAVRYKRTWANPWVWVVWRKQWESPNIMLVVGLEAAKESASVEVMSEIRMSYVVALSVSANA